MRLVPFGHAEKNHLCGMGPYPILLGGLRICVIAQSYAADQVAKEDVFRIT
jgi:hypothetical protein